MRKLKSLLCTLLVLAMAVALFGCGGSGSPTATPGGSGGGTSAPTATPDGGGGTEAPPEDEFVSYTIGVSDYLGRFIQGLVPTECFVAGYAVFDQVFKPDPITKKVVSDVLESWGWEDETTFVMKLKENIVFSNGTPATSADLLYTYTSCVDRGATTLNGIDFVWEDCVARDEYTVALAFERPFRPLVNIKMNLICKEWSEEVGWDSLDWHYPVTSGPYECVDFVSEDHIYLQARDDYWNTEEVGPIYVDEWKIEYYKDASTMFMDLEVGKIDFCELQATDYSRYLKDGGDGYEAIMMLSGNVQFLSFSFEDTDVWNDKRLREAVALGVKWDELGEVAFNDLFVPAKSIAPQDSPYFINPGTYEYNPERSKELLAEAGYGPDNPLKLYTLMMDSQLYKLLSENLQYQLGEIGIELELDFADIASAIQVWNSPGNNDLGPWWSIYGSPTADLYDTIPYVQRGTPTFIQSHDEKFLELWNKMVFSADEAEWSKAMKDLQQYNFDEIFYIPYLEMSGAFGFRTDRFTEEQIRATTVFVNMYQIDRLGYASAWQ